jgi:DNA-binding transcriptional MerR regulator
VSLEFHTGDPEAELDTKSPDAFRTISEVAEDLDIPQHVLRFWETRFAQIKPLKRGGGRRYYRPDDVALLKGIRRLLYGEGYTIKGLQRILKEQGPRHVQAIGRGAPVGPAPGDPAAAAPRPAPIQVTAMPAGMAPADHPPVAQGPAIMRAPQPEGLDDLTLLSAVLSELGECQRLLRGALQPQAVLDGV